MENKKITISINERATNIVLSVLIFAFVLVSLIVAKYYNNFFVNFTNIEQEEVTVGYKAETNWAIAGIYMILMLVAFVLSLVKLLVTTLPIFKRNRNNGVAIAQLVLECLGTILLIIAAFAFLMHKNQLMINESVKPEDITNWELSCSINQLVMSYMSVVASFVTGIFSVITTFKFSSKQAE